MLTPEEFMDREGSKKIFGQVMHFALLLVILVIAPSAHGVDARGPYEGGRPDVAVSRPHAVTPNKSFETPVNDALAAVYRAMEKVPLTGDPDHDFVVMMIPHQQGAIDTAKVVLRYGKDGDIREFAETMIEERQTEIEVMAGWLTRYKPAEGEGPNKTFEAALEKIRSAMNHDREGAGKTKDVDREFLRMMIPHYQGAVDMAKLVHMYGKDPEIRRLADQIIAAQQSDIQMMQRWLTAFDE